MTLELKIAARTMRHRPRGRFARDWTLEQCWEDYARRALPEWPAEEHSYRNLCFDDLIKEDLANALLSFSPWIRMRANELKEEHKKQNINN